MFGYKLVSLVAAAISLAASADALPNLPKGGREFVVERNATGEFDIPPPLSHSGEALPAARYHLESRANGWDYSGKTKVRGVNIGGWLVAEPYITPSLFDNTGDDRVVDEYTFGQYVSDACSRLSAHWDSFYSYNDFQQIKAAGLNHVRIPFPYWGIDEKHGPYCKGNQLDHLTNAVGWSKSLGLKVVIDLHTVPFSANGFDNGGRLGHVGWFSKQDYATRAKNVISTLAQRFTASEYVGTVTAIELVNEPLTTSGPSNALSFLKAYEQDTYYAVRYAQGSNPTDVAVSIHDGFQDLSAWQGFMQPPTFNDVWLDHHQYSVFQNDQVALSRQDRLQFFCNMRDTLASSQRNLYTVVGEWSNAITDCARYVNSRNQGSRYDGSYPGSTRIGSCKGKSGSGANFSQDYKNYLKQIFDTQRNVYETGSGWIYWTWKTESAAEWDYSAGLKYGWITRNLNDRGNVGC